MLALFIVAIINGIIWFILGYMFGKDSGQYYTETELMKRKVKEKRSLIFKSTPSADNLTSKTFSHGK